LIFKQNLFLATAHDALYVDDESLTLVNCREKPWMDLAVSVQMARHNREWSRRT
jgi:hypothetical protein